MGVPEGRMNGPPLLDKVLPYTPYGKDVVVTGGSKGIGRSCVEEFAGLHCRVLTCARSEDDIDKLLQEAKANSWDVHGIGELLNLNCLFFRVRNTEKASCCGILFWISFPCSIIHDKEVYNA